MSSAARIIITILGILLLVALIIFAWRWYVADTENGRVNDEAEQTETDEEIERVLGELPREVTVEQRTVTLEENTIEESPRNDYAEREPRFNLQNDEDPIAYIERYLENELQRQEVQNQAESYNYTVSFSRLDDRDGIMVLVRVMDVPDDSIGGNETRFDFTFRDNNWDIDWVGEQVFCRRPGAENWQPADRPCP
jgi:hypothetical protein